MAVDDAALDRLREDLLAAIRAAILDSEHRIRGEIADAVSASEHRLRGEISASETRLETRLEARLEARLGARIDASAAETRRHMGVIAEGLTSKIALADSCGSRPDSSPVPSGARARARPWRS